MRLFAGLDRSDYQDALRALGRYLDAHGAVDARLAERADGVLLQARPRRAVHTGFQTWALGDEDVLALMRAAYGQRGLGAQGGPGHLGLPYQDLLRAVGQAMDRERWRDLRLLAEPGGVLVQVRGVEGRWRGFQSFRLGAGPLHALVADAPVPAGRSAFGTPLQSPG